MATGPASDTVCLSKTEYSPWQYSLFNLYMDCDHIHTVCTHIYTPACAYCTFLHHTASFRYLSASQNL